jgi:hypothetical protein
MFNAYVNASIVVMPTVITQAMISIDIDDSATRVLILNRISLDVLVNVNVTRVGVLRLRLPLLYGTSNDMLVGILDDTFTYNATFIDGVKGEIINGVVTKI